MTNNIAQILGDFLDVNGVTAVALVGRDGFVIDSVGSDNVDIDALGALIATAAGANESLSDSFNLGAFDQCSLEFKSGKVTMAAVADDILAIFTDETAVIGGVRYAIKKGMPKILESLA